MRARTHTHTHMHQSRRDRHTVLAKSCCSLDVRQPARAVSVSRRATSVDVSLTSPQPRLTASEPSACLVKIVKSQRPIVSTIYKVTIGEHILRICASPRVPVRG